MDTEEVAKIVKILQYIGSLSAEDRTQVQSAAHKSGIKIPGMSELSAPATQGGVRDMNPRRTAGIQQAFQQAASEALVGDMVTNPMDAQGLGQPGSAGSYSTSDLMSEPGSYLPQIQSTERDYNNELDTARARWQQEQTRKHGVHGSVTDMPDWLKDTAVAPDYIKKAALDWRLGQNPGDGMGGQSKGGDASQFASPKTGYDPYSTP